MRKGFKVLIISLMVTIIMVVALSGTVFAAGGPDSGDCPNPDCPNADCPNPDCPSDGNGPMYQHGSHGPQYQYRSG